MCPSKAARLLKSSVFNSRATETTAWTVSSSTARDPEGENATGAASRKAARRAGYKSEAEDVVDELPDDEVSSSIDWLRPESDVEVGMSFSKRVKV
jgi:hypothetical protein